MNKEGILTKQVPYTLMQHTLIKHRHTHTHAQRKKYNKNTKMADY